MNDVKVADSNDPTTWFKKSNTYIRSDKPTGGMAGVTLQSRTTIRSEEEHAIKEP